MGNQMAKGKNNIPKLQKEVSPHDEMILNEFFSLIVRIAIRLTSKDAKDENDITPSGQEVLKE